MTFSFGNAEHFLRLLGADEVIIDRDRGWVRSACPLARWMHRSGRDRHPSFGIHVDDEKAPFFHCYSCGTSGSLPKLIHNLEFLSQDRLIEASNYLSQHELFDTGEEKIRTGRRVKVTDRFEKLDEREIRRNLEVPENVLQQYPLLSEPNPLQAHKDALLWLVKTRNISLKAIKDFQLRLYVAPILEDVGVVFPILDKTGTKVFDMWVRLIEKKQNFRLTRAYAGGSVDYKAPNLWFGNHLFDPKRPVVLVEGAIDALRLYSLGITNVLASFGEPSTEQLENFYAPVTYLGFDNDEAGARFAKRALGKIDSPSISILNWGVVDKKDAGELESEAEFRQVFDKCIKVIRSPKIKEERKVSSEPVKTSILKTGKDGLFL